MKTLICIAGSIAALVLFAPVAEAARCPQGYIYRPSKGVCQYKPTYTRQARASVKHRYKRAKVVKQARVKQKPARVAEVVMLTSPMWYTMQPDPFQSPFGRIVLPITNYDPVLASWASLRMWRNEP